MSHPTFATMRNLVLGTAGAFALCLAASSSSAQDYNDEPDSYRAGEQVIVVAPPYHGRSSTTGAPIRDVAMSREVFIGDLDLRTRWGERALLTRVRSTARTLCNKLDHMYPVSDDNSPDCYRTAVDNAMAQAYDAIDRARSD